MWNDEHQCDNAKSPAREIALSGPRVPDGRAAAFDLDQGSAAELRVVKAGVRKSWHGGGRGG